jgi:hypothetical protein
MAIKRPSCIRGMKLILDSGCRRNEPEYLMSRHSLEFGVGANDFGNGLLQDNRPQLFHVRMREHKLARVDIDWHVVIDDYFFRVAVVVEDQAVDTEVVDGLVIGAEDLVYEVGVVLYCAED